MFIKLRPCLKKSLGEYEVVCFSPHDFISFGRLIYSFWNFGRTNGVLTCIEEDHSTANFPVRADFVVIMITPCAAADPYNAAAAAPLNTETLSTSSGLISDIPSAPGCTE